MALTQRVSFNSISGLLRTTSTQISKNTSFTSKQWAPITLISPSITIPAFSIPIPGILADIWEGILKAVPKKKTSHMKKRHRQLAGKALKDVNAVNSCPGCGKPKKAHTLCPYCVAGMSWMDIVKKLDY